MIIQLIDLVICIDRGLVISVMQRSHSDVAVYPLLLLLRRVGIDVCIEDRCIVIEVKGKLRPVEEGILGKLRIMKRIRRILECIQSGHLVLCLDIAVTKMIVCDLSERIRTVGHVRVAPDRAFIIIDRIKHRSAVEPVGTAIPHICSRT